MHTVLFIVLMLAAGCASALDPIPPRPVAGIYWDGTGSGRFVHVDVGPTGYIAGVITGFDRFTEPTYYTFQGVPRFVNPQPDNPLAVIAWLDGPLHEVTGGSCWGCEPSALPVAPRVIGHVSIDFVFDGRLRLRTFNSETWFTRFPLYETDAGERIRRFPGKWLVAARSPTTDETGVISMEPNPSYRPEALLLRCLHCSETLRAMLPRDLLVGSITTLANGEVGLGLRIPRTVAGVHEPYPGTLVAYPMSSGAEAGVVLRFHQLPADWRLP